MIGRISIGRVVEKNGKRLPEKDDQFTITTQIQTREGWLPHPLDETLRQEVQGKKLRSIPVTLPFNDPDLNLRAEYTFFERKSGRPLCSGDGETCRRRTDQGLKQLPCPSPDLCEFGAHDLCKPYGRLYVRIGEEDELGCFVFRTTGYNSIRTLAARLRTSMPSLAATGHPAPGIEATREEHYPEPPGTNLLRGSDTAR